MKKRTRCLLLVFLFCLVLCVSAAAAEQTGAQLSYVTDEAGLLSENENMLLEKMAEGTKIRRGQVLTGIIGPAIPGTTVRLLKVFTNIADRIKMK